jgi:uncharacterized protein (DUF302 family)
MDYGFGKEVALGYAEAIELVTEELKKEGFGVLTSIDVKDTLKKKIDKDFNRYIILGACNPNFAFRALSTVRNIGLLLPCNVIVHENDAGQTKVEFFNPLFMSEVIDDDGLLEIAGQVNDALRRVLAALPQKA